MPGGSSIREPGWYNCSTVASSTVPGNVQPTQTVTTEGKTETTPVNPTVVKPTVTETEVETEIKPGGAVKTPDTGIELTYTKDRKGAAFYQKDGKYYVIPDENNYYTSYEVTDPKRIENIKKFKGDQRLISAAFRKSRAKNRI